MQRHWHGDGAVLLVAAARKNTALAAVDSKRPVELVLETDTAESTQETGHVGPLVQTILSQTHHSHQLTTTVLRPLYGSTCVGRHLRFRVGGFCWCLWSGTTRVGRYQKKHSPTHTHPDHRASFIIFLHLQRSMASSLFNLCAWESSRTTSFQFFFGLPLGLEPSTDLQTNCNKMA